MKNIIIYAVIFTMAFIGTSVGVYIFNSKYVNMFEFDFRDRGIVEAAIADSLAALAADSLDISSSLLTEENFVEEKAKELEENLNSTKWKLSKAEGELSKKDTEIKNLRALLEQKIDNDRESWLKSTIKLYESMEAVKASELLSALPEDEAREILYSMKNKKAAQILSNLDVSTVKRLTRAKR